jgi:hypothetical protein
MIECRTHAISAKARRNGLVEWAISDSTHALDLAPNRIDSLTLAGLERMFRLFCLEVDRYLLGVKHVHLRSSHDRLRMIAFPEKLDVNPHLHGFANFSAAHWGDRIDRLPWEWKLGQIWNSVSGGSGTIHIAADPDAGKAWYSTKEALRRDHDYLHSWDFHRADKIVARPSGTPLQRRAATRRSRTH